MYKHKLKDKLYSLLCQYEEGKDWEKFLNIILKDLFIYSDDTDFFYLLFFKISSLQYLNYKFFRSTIFDCINMISKDGEK